MKTTTNKVIQHGLSILVALHAVLSSLAAYSQTNEMAHMSDIANIQGIGVGMSPQLAKQYAHESLIEQVNQRLSYQHCLTHAKSNSHCPKQYLDVPLPGIVYHQLPSNLHPFQFSASLDLTSASHELTRLIDQLKAEVEQHQPSPTQSLTSLWIQRHQLHTYQRLANLIRINRISTKEGKDRVDATTTDQALLQNTDLIKNIELINKTEKQLWDTAPTIRSLTEIPIRLRKLGNIELAYIHAPHPTDSMELTPFSSLIRKTIENDLVQRFPNQPINVRGLKPTKQMQPQKPQQKVCYDKGLGIEIHCQTAIKPSSPALLLTGDYSVDPQGDILLRYRLNSTKSGLINAIFFRIPRSVVGPIRINPLDLTFEQQINQNILPNQTFRASMTTNRGHRNLLVYEHETLEINIKLSQPGFYYLVGHVVQPSQQYAYLIQLNSHESADTQTAGTPSYNPFVKRITPSEANTWISIGRFTVSPPFGVEHLQLVAADYDLKEHLPPTRWDETLGYYLITGTNNQAGVGVSLVREQQKACQPATHRGVQRNCNPIQGSVLVDTAKKIQEHETTISYTSMSVH